MKNKLLILLASSLLLGQCSPDKAAMLTPKIDKDQASIKLMKELIPQLTGTWTMRQTQIKAQNSTFHGELKIKKDTTLINFATLTFAPSSVQYTPTQTRYEGYIHYGSNYYPIRFELLAGPWIFNQKGPKAYFLLDRHVPAGNSQPTVQPSLPEVYFLQQIGLIYETFSLDITSGQSTMVWRGLNRGMEQIELVKK